MGFPIVKKNYKNSIDKFLIELYYCIRKYKADKGVLSTDGTPFFYGQYGRKQYV